MPSNWPKVRLEDATTILGDGLHGTPEYDDRGDYYFINGNNLCDGRIVFNEKTRRVGEVEYQRHQKKLNDRTILVSINGTLGNVAIYRGEKVVLGKSVCYFNVRPGVDKHFVRYVIDSSTFQDYIHTLATGSTIKNVSLRLMRDFVFQLPALEQQKSISATLLALDDRIDLLRQTNATLESIAQALFKSWFIDFDPVRAKAEGRQPEGMDAATATLFPSEFEESALGLIPKGWVPGKLEDICLNPRVQARPEHFSPDTSYIGLEHMPRKNIALDSIGTAEGLESGKFWFERNDVLFGKLRPYFHKVGLAPGQGVCSTDILVLRPKKPEWLGFLIMHASSDALIAYATQLSNGARMPRTSWRDVSRFEIVLPPQVVASAFNALVSPLFERIHANIACARNLAELRDTLLPRLISGKLRIPEAEAILEDAIA
jgi:type I restriction enzyme S subunit